MRAAAAFGGLLVWAMAAGNTAGAQEPTPSAFTIPPDTGGVAVDPAEVVAGMFYHGAVVHVSAVVPRGASVAVLCTGERRDLFMKLKGKVLGVLWMNTGDIEFHDVPDVYMLHTSEPLSDLAPSAILEELELGVDALATGRVPEGQDPKLFGELAGLREKDGLWAIGEGAAEVRPGESELDADLATTDFTLPAKVPPGQYEVLVYAFRGADPELIGRSELTVTQGGPTAAITELATEHGLLYGILAVVVAVVVGLLTGVVFGLGSKGGH